MDKAFRDMIRELFEEEILGYMKKDIQMNYEEYNLYMKTRFVENIQGATVDNIRLLNVCGIKQFGSNVIFDLIVDCSLEVYGFAYDEEMYENIHQLFKLSCSSLLECAALEKFNILRVQAFNKHRKVMEWT